MAVMNFAKKVSTQVDERFKHESYAQHVLGNKYEFKGVKTIQVYSFPTVAMNDYKREGANRYGTPTDLLNQVQEMTVTKDRGWTFVIDKGDNTQNLMLHNAGKACQRQMSEVVIPEFDTYVFNTLAHVATDNGQADATALTKSNAYGLFLDAQETLGNKRVPAKGRIAICSYKFANQLMQDPAFVKQGNASQEMVIKGQIGDVDGTRILRVPAALLPTGCDFILTHPIAAVGPKQLSEYKIHTDPPGLSGWLCEGRFIYDCFVLDNKKDAIFYHGTALATE